MRTQAAALRVHPGCSPARAPRLQQRTVVDLGGREGRPDLGGGVAGAVDDAVLVNLGPLVLGEALEVERQRGGRRQRARLPRRVLEGGRLRTTQRRRRRRRAAVWPAAVWPGWRVAARGGVHGSELRRELALPVAAPTWTIGLQGPAGTATRARKWRLGQRCGWNSCEG